MNKAKTHAIGVAIHMAKTNKKSYVVRDNGGFGQPDYYVIAQDAVHQPGTLVMTAEYEPPGSA